MAVEYEISSDVAVIKETGSVSQCARVTQMYSGQITYDDEAGSKFATATINGKSQRVMLCIAVNGTVNYDDVPSLYSTVDGHRCLNIVTPTETGTPDDVPSLYETVVIDGQNVRAVRCIMINKTPVYDGVSSTCTFTGDDGKTHTAQLVNKITGGSTVVIIKGTSPLNLPDAIADSLSYVKAFGGTEQRNLPDNYIQRQFIYMLDGSYIWTDIVPESGGKVEMDFQTTTTAAQVASYLGAREPSSPVGNGLRLTHGTTATRPIIIYGFEEGGDYQASAGFSNNTRYKFTYDNGVATVYSGDTLVASHTFTPNSTCTTPLAINGVATSTVSGNIEGIYLYSFKVWNTQGELVADYVPAVEKGTVPVVGFYDTVSGTFKTATAGTFAAGGEAVPTPGAPMDIVSNNGVIKSLKSATGSTTQAGTPTPASPIPLVSYQQNNLVLRGVGAYADSYSSSTQTVTRRVGVKIFDGTEGWNQRDAQSGNRVFQLLSAGSIVPYVLVNNSPALCTHLEYKGTVSGISAVNSGGIGIYFYRSNDYPNARNVYIKVPQSIADTVEQLQAWFAAQLANSTPVTLFCANATESTETVPAVYVEGTVETIEDTIGNTATAEILLKVDDYQDVQEILSGAITRNIGVKVLDGTENNWTKSNNSFANIDLFSDRAAGKILLLCSHFQYDEGSTTTIPNGCVGDALNSQNVYFRYDTCNTVADWQQWLADQNAAGTPVIIVYPLATATTESVAVQTLQVTDGDNVLEITQASLRNLELEAQYKAAVQLTIQEVEDANLDNNVEVTIS